MSRLDAAAAKLMAALDALEAAAAPLAEARTERNAGLIAERDNLLTRVAELEDETRSLAGVSEEVEERLDSAIAEIRTALGR